jgi:hypothetical protein
MDARHRHNITWAEAESDTAELAQEAYGAARVRSNYLSLNGSGRPPSSHRAGRLDPEEFRVIRPETTQGARR